MKAVTEFPGFTLNKAIETKAALTSAGKSAEEIETGLGEAFKFEGDKLKHFVQAIEVATTNKENLKRVVVLSLNEGEVAPAKSVKVEESYYLPEFIITARPAPADAGKGGRGNRKGGGRGGDSKKSSPWGLSPEEKAAKNKPQKP